ncbi:MAG: oligosaccharide flippase family protein [Proteobacteria bacterium]|nr:oligosaccharide flippase family protein [Pseudomonadota bacterium]
MSLLRSGSILFATTMVANVSNYFFQFFMSRHLALDQFGAMNAVFSMLSILAVPTTTIMLVVAKYSALFRSESSDDKLSALYRNALVRVAIVGLIFPVLIIFFNGTIQEYLKIESRVPIVIVGITLFWVLILTVNLGMLQGLQRFLSFGLSIGFSGLLKLLFGVLFVVVGFGLNGAVASVGVATIIIFCVTFYLLRSFFAKNEGGAERHTVSILSYGVPVLLATLAFTILTNVDLLMVKHLFTPEEAGLYSAVSVLGKTVLYLPAALVLALFPMVAEAHSLSQDTFKLLKKGLLYTVGISLAGVLLFVIWPGPVMTLLFGAKFVVAAPMLKYYGLSMGLMALVSIIMSFNLARHKSGFIYSLGAGCVSMVVLINLFHGSLQTVIFAIIVNNLLILAFNLWLVYREKRFAYLHSGVEVECGGE